MTNFMTATELAQLRADFAELMPDTAVIQSVTLVSDGAGGNTPSWAAVTGGTVACRIDPLNLRGSRVQLVAIQESLLVSYQGTFPHDAPLAENYRVVTGSNTYEVVQLDVDHSNRACRRAILSEIR